MLKVDTRDLDREIQGLEKRIGEAHQKLVANLVGWTLQDLIETSPVRTGAYRASHAVLDSGGSLLYEGPERPGGEEQIPVGSRPILEPPNAADAERSVAAAEPYQRLEVWNGRFYASILEYGSPTMAPSAIYQTAEANAELRAEELARGGLDL